MWHEFSIKIILGEPKKKKKSKLFSESQSYNYIKKKFFEIVQKTS